ncbi:protein of unknown function (plasmid) [Cupriavidus neocaledonicus]|uniref:Uncharacterized protein n=1 Tax=Cupriavidus neocaledonicus TaxID=1040979 RepID=A0A375HLW6_9BURK|nr:hypothetical protein CBM2605_B130398 [Cupriavidus neocaledonicus]SPD59229.1 protein of unknown function [Cupriavidus neocaledonicus]
MASRRCQRHSVGYRTHAGTPDVTLRQGPTHRPCRGHTPPTLAGRALHRAASGGRICASHR